MIMAVQRFQIMETRPGLPGERVCYGCKVPETMADTEPGEAAAVLEMDHADDCPEVSNLARVQQ
jgi:hypothetical protein